MSKEKETGGAGPETITRQIGDPGQASYGIYQFTTKWGVAKDFALSPEAAPWRNLFGKEPAPGNASFDAAWQAAAAADPSGFERAQHEFYKRSAYVPFVKDLNARVAEKLESKSTLNFNKSSYVLQDVLWSTSVHHGPTGGKNVLDNAMRNSDFLKKVQNYSHGPWNREERARLKMEAERDLIAAIYIERGRTDANGVLVYFKTAGADFAKGLKLRFVEEAQLALTALEREGGVKRP